jgi:hypothetical protein
LLAYWSWLELGVPSETAKVARLAGNLPLSSQQTEAAYRLHGELVCVLSVRFGNDCGRGRQSLFNLISNILEDSKNEADSDAKLFNLSEQSTTAVDVVSERISLPAEAGLCDPLQYLNKAECKTLENLHKIVIPNSDLPCNVPKPCLMIDATQESLLRRRLASSKMAILIKECDVPVGPHGRKLLAGLFAVWHKVGRDRLIVDRRPQNFCEGRLRWAQLPHGCMLAQFRLKAGEVLRGSGDDVSNFFYNIRHAESWWHRNCVGRVFTGAEAKDLGGDPRERYHLALCVCAMGDLNSVDIAQRVHERILESEGGFPLEGRLVYGEPMPSTAMVHGVYVDDLLVLRKLLQRDWFDSPAPDVVQMEKCRTAYSKANLPQSAEKAFRCKGTFVGWGTTVLGVEGRAFVCRSKRLQLFVITNAFLCLKKFTLRMIQRLVGLFVHPFAIRRCCMSVFHRTYKWMAEFDEARLGLMGDGVEKVFEMPRDIRDEFVAAAAHVLVAEADLRAQVSTRIACTDATPSRGGVVSARVSRQLSESLFDRGMFGGFRTRLDWKATDYEVLTKAWEDSSYAQVAANGVNNDITDLLDATPWQVDWEDNFPETAHVNLQEALGVKRRLVMSLSEGTERLRIVTFSDSWVVIGAWGKGRSSSILLNGVLRSCMGWQILGGRDMVCIYCPTAFNPADDPSRSAPPFVFLTPFLPPRLLRCCAANALPAAPLSPVLLPIAGWSLKCFRDLVVYLTLWTLLGSGSRSASTLLDIRIITTRAMI